MRRASTAMRTTIATERHDHRRRGISGTHHYNGASFNGDRCRQTTITTCFVPQRSNSSGRGHTCMRGRSPPRRLTCNATRHRLQVLHFANDGTGRLRTLMKHRRGARHNRRPFPTAHGRATVLYRVTGAGQLPTVTGTGRGRTRTGSGRRSGHNSFSRHRPRLSFTMRPRHHRVHRHRRHRYSRYKCPLHRLQRPRLSVGTGNNSF